jgi:hypothetical protein
MSSSRVLFTDSSLPDSLLGLFVEEFTQFCSQSFEQTNDCRLKIVSSSAPDVDLSDVVLRIVLKGRNWATSLFGTTSDYESDVTRVDLQLARDKRLSALRAAYAKALDAVVAYFVSICQDKAESLLAVWLDESCDSCYDEDDEDEADLIQEVFWEDIFPDRSANPLLNVLLDRSTLLVVKSHLEPIETKGCEALADAPELLLQENEAMHLVAAGCAVRDSGCWNPMMDQVQFWTAVLALLTVWSCMTRETMSGLLMMSPNRASPGLCMFLVPTLRRFPHAEKLWRFLPYGVEWRQVDRSRYAQDASFKVFDREMVDCGLERAGSVKQLIHFAMEACARSCESKKPVTFLNPDSYYERVREGITRLNTQ